MKNLQYYILFLVLQVLISACQSSGPLLQKTEVLSGNTVSADVLGNVYISGSGNTIQKYVNGKLKFTQNIKLYGSLTMLDVSNPMEIYVFFRDAAQIVFLDNTLSFRGSMDLSGKGIITCMCRSFDNGVWLFDQTEMQLKKSDKTGNILQTSGNAAITGAKQLNPFFMQDDGNYIYMADSSSGIYIYDLNANFIRKIHAPGVTTFYAENNIIRYLASGTAYEFDLKSSLSRTIGKADEKGFLVRDRLYRYCNDSIYCVTTLQP